MPVEEALEVSLQIAEGLEAAHERGIIHRDLKPANVKITPEGKVKILDFGLAKALEGEIPAADISHSPTRTGEMTSAGVILGTAAYMSPEQARGKPVDKRTDIWAFGCVLFEALTGRQEFGGETISDCIAKVLQKEPDWEPLPEKTPWRIQDLLRRCLQKDSHERLQHIGDARIEIKHVLSDPLGITPLPVEAPWPRSSWRLALPWVLFGIMTIVAFTLALIDSGETPEKIGAVHFPIFPPEPVSNIVLPTVSPDGRQIVFAGRDNTGNTSLWVRKMDSPIAQRLEGTDQAAFWSPDSRFVAFFADGKLKKIDPSGGPATSLADAPPFPYAGTWNRQGTIIFGTGGGGLYRVSAAAGGEATSFTTLDPSRQERTHRSPHFLPDGRHFVFAAWTSVPEEDGIYLGSLDSNQLRLLVSAPISNVAYAPPGYLLFNREGSLMAQAFDANQLELFGEPFPIAKGLGNFPSFSVSDNGALAYIAGNTRNRLVWRDRSGKEIGGVGDPGRYMQVALSPDQQRVAVSRVTEGAPDIWLLELQSGILSRFTVDPAVDSQPIWSPDGGRLLFGSRRNGPMNLFQKTVGGGAVEVAFESKDDTRPKAWSRAGHIVYTSARPKKSDSGNAVYALRLDKEGKAETSLLFEDSFQKGGFRLSPDHKRIAYHSNESGRFQVYVADFPGFSRKRQISSAGGRQPQWRRDGKELFFLEFGMNGRLMSVDLDTDSTVGTGIPQALFQTGASGGGRSHQYCVTSEGQRFFLIEPVEGKASPIHVVQNWIEKLKQKVPTGN